MKVGGWSPVFLLLLWVLSVPDRGVGSELTDRAYRAYREGHVKEAVELYRQAVVSAGSTAATKMKAWYNLGVLYHRGQGLERDEIRALEAFRQAVRWGERSLKSEREENEARGWSRRKILRESYRYLIRLEPGGKAREVARRRFAALDTKEQCVEPTELPAVQRPWLEEVPHRLRCESPARIRQIFRLRERYERCVKRFGERGMERCARLKRQALRLARPMLREAFEERIRCVERAETIGERWRCDFAYWHLMDALALTRRVELEYRGLHGIDPRLREKESRRAFAGGEKARYLRYLKKALRQGAYIEVGVQ